MSGARLNPRRPKIHCNYTIAEVAELLGVHRNTVRAWIRAGLPTIDSRRPLLILGDALAEFMRKRRDARRRTCRPGEIYCLRCREPRRPAGGVVEFRVKTPARGNLVGHCSACGAGMNRAVSSAKVGIVLGDLTIQYAEHQEHIVDRHEPTLDSDLDRDADDHAKTPS